MNNFESSDVDKGTVKSSKQVAHGNNYFFGLHRAPVFLYEKTQLTIFLPKAKKISFSKWICKLLYKKEIKKDNFNRKCS